jgi:hypothetical protein
MHGQLHAYLHQINNYFWHLYTLYLHTRIFLDLFRSMPTVPMWQSQVMKRQGLEGKQLLCGPGFDYNWVSITIQWEWQKFLGFVFAENEKSCGWNHFVGCGLCQPYPYLKYNGSAPYIWHALSACLAVWPDWANFRQCIGRLFTDTDSFFNYRSSANVYLDYSFSGLQVTYSFWQKSCLVTFWGIFHKLTLSPCLYE